MRSRLEFNFALVRLLTRMGLEGEAPVIDFVKRSDQEQKRLYDEGKSKCDGINTISYHQFGRAVDIYFIRDGQVVDPLAGWDYWHDVWDEFGGRERISWDLSHFEG